MPTCGGLRIGVLSIEPNTPPLVMVNVPPRRSSSVSVPSLGAPGEVADGRVRCPQTTVVGVAQDRHDESLRGADGDADVVVVLEHHLVALDLGVEAGTP
jgi:hypothetical protein